MQHDMRSTNDTARAQLAHMAVMRAQLNSMAKAPSSQVTYAT